MSKQTINIGIRANDGKGDTLRAAFTKTNSNFTELYTNVSNNANTANSKSANNQILAQGAYNKANTVFLGNMSFTDNFMYSNTSIQIGNDRHDQKSWGMLFGEINEQAGYAWASGIAYDNENNILVAMTTPNYLTELTQSTVVKFGPKGEIFWRKSVPAANIEGTLVDSYASGIAVDANNNVYLLTNIPDDNSTLVSKFNYVGETVWNTSISDSINSYNIVVDDEGFPYYVGEHNLITGLDVTGELYFTYFNADIADAEVVISLPNRGGVLIGSNDGYVHKFSAEGVYQWSNKVNGNDANIISLSWDEDNNYYVSTDTYIYKFEPDNQLAWEKEILGQDSPNIVSIKYSNSYLYAMGTSENADGKYSFNIYKIHSANGELAWANSVEVDGAGAPTPTPHEIDVRGDYLVGTGYSFANNSSCALATTFQLPIDGSLSGTYFGTQSATWGDFSYVRIPEAGTTTSDTVGSGNTTITIAENTNYAYTMNVVDYEAPSSQNEQSLKYFYQQWKFNEDGTLIIPSSGSDLAIEFSGKNVANVGSMTARTSRAMWDETDPFELDTNVLINKLVPQSSGGPNQYHLGDGVEGQIMYIVPTGPFAGNEYTSMTIANARWSDGNGYIYEGQASWWLPFEGSFYRGSATVTLIFTDGSWNLPHNTFD